MTEVNKLGLGAMLWQLSGGSKKNADDYYGLRIKNATFADDKLRIDFENGKSVVISDEGQSCCESRYMTTDDKVEDLIGGILLDITLKDAPNIEDEYGGDHEVNFMEVKTDQAIVTFASHNEHNGYYGGICLSLDEVESE